MVQKARPKLLQGKKGLKLKAPSTLRLKDYGKLLVPMTLEDSEDFAPLDFTSLGSREVGRQHSAWSVRHSHLLFLIGNLRAEVGNLKHDLKNEESRWIIANVGDYKNKWEADYAMGTDKKIKELRGTLKTAEASLARYEALAGSYQGLIQAASREMTRRSTEVGPRD